MFDEQALLIFRFTFDGATNPAGNLRFDNVRVSGESIPRPVPEPATILLLGTGVAGVAARVRKSLKMPKRSRLL